MIKIKELKRITYNYIYYDNKMFHYSYTYYSLVEKEGEFIWRQWNKKFDRWIYYLNVINEDNMYWELYDYLQKQYYNS